MQLKIRSCKTNIDNACADPEGGGGYRGSGHRPLRNHKNIGFPSDTDPEPLKNHKAAQANIQCWAINGTPAKCHLNSVSLAGR